MTARDRKTKETRTEADLCDELARRVESVDRGEGLTTEALVRELTRRRAEAVASKPVTKTRSRSGRA